MVIFTGLTPIAERPTGAGLTLGMGLSCHYCGAGLMTQRRRSPAKPDGLGGVELLLTDEEGILARGGNFLARRCWRAFCSVCSEVNIRTAIFSAEE
jgi:hypothetical protein